MLSPELDDISTWPEWTDCPFRSEVPKALSVRKRGDEVALYWPEYRRYVLLTNRLDREPIFERVLLPMINALSGSAFESAHPEAYGPMIRRQARWRLDGNEGNPPEDAALWADYDRLHFVGEIGASAA